MDGRRDREPGALGVSHVDDDDAIGAKGAKDFATPGSMSVDTPAQKKKDDDWWGDESWHGSGSWDAHGWDAWYRGTHRPGTVGVGVAALGVQVSGRPHLCNGAAGALWTACRLRR